MVRDSIKLLASKRFWAGVLVGLLSPALTFFLLHSLWWLATEGKVGGFAPGPQCYALDRKEAIAPNGRFIATSVIIDCEDDNERNELRYNYVFVSAIRLSRSGQVYSSLRALNEPAMVSWNGNNTILIQKAADDIERVKSQWCGIEIEAERTENR